MVNQSNSKVVGAFVVGLALVSGAYFLSNFGQGASQVASSQSVTTVEAPLRQPINVSDSNQDGIEDWQEEFVQTSTINVISNLGGGDDAPKTLTGQVGVAFMEDIILAKGYGDFGRSQEQVIADTVSRISDSGADDIYDINDLIIGNDSSEISIKIYADSHSKAITESGVPGLRSELIVLREVLGAKSPEKGLAELEAIRNVYKNTRDRVLSIPVPPLLVKEHLDLINVYNALYHDLDGMTKIISDPMVTFVRIKRYDTDSQALKLTLENMFFALESYSSLFKLGEPSALFLIFNPKR